MSLCLMKILHCFITRGATVCIGCFVKVRFSFDGNTFIILCGWLENSSVFEWPIDSYSLKFSENYSGIFFFNGEGSGEGAYQFQKNL